MSAEDRALGPAGATGDREETGNTNNSHLCSSHGGSLLVAEQYSKELFYTQLWKNTFYFTYKL